MNIESYMEGLTEKLKAHFGQRLIYVGLQGSYLRGEANEESDFIKIVQSNKGIVYVPLSKSKEEK